MNKESRTSNGANKKTLILGGVLIILVALAYAYQGPLKRWQSNLGKPKNFLAKIDFSQLDKIEINNQGRQSIIEKSGDRWRVGNEQGFAVSNEIVSGAIAKLEEAAKAELELISGNKKKRDDFKAGDKGVKVSLYAKDKELASLIIGKTGSDFKSTYISRPEISSTYLLKNVNLSYVFSREDWRDKTIFSGEQNNISQIRFQYPNSEFSIEKADDRWSVVGTRGYNLGEEKIKPILEIMSSLTAADIPEQNFAGTGLEEHLIIVQAKGEGIDNTIMVGGENKDGLYFAKRGDSDNIYLIDKAQHDQLNKQIWQLR